ncbi:hypothetical protein [Pararobbsia silviterrae]|uniref:Uncharacterized protein n=1 Tax=Pararobbsia silviterrae TaxID=1792498 RepID=A0A494XRQ0_9BURK|nr:hypothetical protein [Pararobbsia silviterrae]RKP53308.1 hypothetical protein D7S86_16400 [Pararobbsia silviterrae]
MHDMTPLPLKTEFEIHRSDALPALDRDTALLRIALLCTAGHRPGDGPLRESHACGPADARTRFDRFD